MSAYADTSFVVSLYTPDVNSLTAARQMRRTTLPVLMTALGELEFINALQLRVFRHELNGTESREAALVFRQDLESGIFLLKPLTAGVLEGAKQLSGRRTSSLAARTLDLARSVGPGSRGGSTSYFRSQSTQTRQGGEFAGSETSELIQRIRFHR